MKYEIWKKQHRSGTQNLFLKETQNGIHEWHSIFKIVITDGKKMYARFSLHV